MGAGCSSENTIDASASSNAPDSHAAGGGKNVTKKGKVSVTLNLVSRQWGICHPGVQIVSISWSFWGN